MAAPRDIVDQLEIETLAASESELRARVIELEEDAAVYREIAVAAIDALRRLTLQLDELRAAHHRLQDEYRWLREERLLGAADDESADAA